MPWNATFPTGPTLINQSVTPFQNNWAFLATNIGTDHYFNVGAPNEGHHKFVQYVNQSPNPATAVDGCSFTRSTGPVATPAIIPSWPHFKNASYTYRQILGFSRQFVAGGAGTINLFTFTASVDGPIAGTFYVYLNGTPSRCASVNFFWDGTTLATIPTSFFQANNQITALGLISGGNTTIMQATVAGAGTYNWAFTAIPFGT